MRSIDHAFLSTYWNLSVFASIVSIEAVETIAEAAAVPVMEEDVWEDADSEEQFESFDESEDLEAPYWEDLVDPDATS